jgi:hypothetical protein
MGTPHMVWFLELVSALRNLILLVWEILPWFILLEELKKRANDYAIVLAHSQ